MATTLPRIHDLAYAGEIYPIAIDLAGKIPAGAALSSGVASVVDVTAGVDADSFLVSTTASISGTQAIVVKQAGGTVGHVYEVSVLATLNTGTPAYKVKGVANVLVLGE